MVHQLSRLKQDPICLLTWSRRPDQAEIAAAFHDLNTRLAAPDAPLCVAIDLSQQDKTPTSLFLALLQDIFRAIQAQHHRSPQLVFVILLGQYPTELDADLEPLAEVVPLFETLDAAYTYLRLRIDSSYLRQSLTLQDTHDFDQTAPLIPEAFEILDATETVQPISLSSLERAPHEFPAGALLRLKALDLDRSMLVFPHRGVVIGRRDTNGPPPDVDLSLWAGYRRGVSRQHVRLSVQNNRLYVYDLESTNGTLLNGKRLVPRRGYEIHHSDELCLGKLKLVMTFEVSASR